MYIICPLRTTFHSGCYVKGLLRMVFILSTRPPQSKLPLRFLLLHILLTWCASLFSYLAQKVGTSTSVYASVYVLCHILLVSLARQLDLPFMCHRYVSHKPLELIFSDVWGPSSVESSSSCKYYIQFIDDFTKYSWLYPLHAKSDVYYTFQVFKSKVENVLNARITTL